MGFFGDLGNWLWDGVILNLIFGAGAGALLFLGWGLLYLVLGYVAQNDVYRGLMSSDEDNPVGVVLLCLLTPVLVIGVFGLGVGLIFASFTVVFAFFLNLIPFTGWGESDAGLLFENLNFIVEIPLLFYRGSAYYAMAQPLLTGIVTLLFTVVAFGYLFPSGENRGSLGDTNRQYAALSIAMFLALFSVILMMSFSSVAAWMYEYEVERYGPYSEKSMEIDFDPDVDWMPNYTYQSSEGRESFGNGDEFSLEFGRTGLVDYTTSPQAIECLSLNTLTDEVDGFHYFTKPGVDAEFHVRLVGERNLSIYTLTATTRDQPSQTAHYATTGLEFHSRDIANNPAGAYRDVGFAVGISLEENETFASEKYHLVYVHAPNGITSNTKASLDEIVADLDHPQDCDVVALTGALEPRARLSSLVYGFGGMFLFGCVFHRYYVITGRDGTTDPEVLFRTFLQSQAFSVVLYAFLLFAFDPLDGTGVTGLRKEWIAEVTIFAGKVGILLVLLALIGILAAALYRQRGNIGDAMTAMIDRDRELKRIEREWYGNP
jgi:hypothetical protein